MLAVMSAWFPTLGHPIPKDVDIACPAPVQAEIPDFSWVPSPVLWQCNALAVWGGCGVGALSLPVDPNQFGHRPLPNKSLHPIACKLRISIGQFSGTSMRSPRILRMIAESASNLQ